MTYDLVLVKQLKRRAYWGLYSDVAKDLGVTRAAVMGVMKGTWCNSEILNACIRRIEEKEQQTKEQNAKLAKTVKRKVK